MSSSNCDVIILGTGIGACAIANQLRRTGAHIVMMPGVGRARFKHLEGGIIEPRILQRAFGDMASAPVRSIGAQTVFRRDQLEDWALDQVRPHVEVLTDFDEARVIPHDSGQSSLQNDAGDKSIRANSMVLTEGANPKIGIAHRLRPDFSPSDLIHFGRTIVPGVSIDAPQTGEWRTSWNMPAWYSLIPLPEGVAVGLSTRIENVMRSSRDGRVVLSDFLESPLAQQLGVAGTPDEIGMELVGLRSGRSNRMIAAHNISISLDANGVIDARELRRFNAGLSSGIEMGNMLAREWPNLVEWDEVGISGWDVFTAGRKSYHDDSTTGFIEDGPGERRGLLGRLFGRE